MAPASSLNLNADQSAWFWTRYWDVEHQGIVTVVPVVHIKEDRFSMPVEAWIRPMDSACAASSMSEAEHPILILKRRPMWPPFS